MTQSPSFPLAACAEMLWRDRPIEWRVSRLKEMGFAVGLWNWTTHDLAALERTGAQITIINGFLRGGLADDAGAAEMLATARETVAACRRLNVARFCLLGRALDDVAAPNENPSPAMWLKARDTLCRMADLAEELDVTFALENLNWLVDHPGIPFSRAEDTLALVSSINHPRLVLNLDLYHVQIGAGNLIETCRRCLPWIGEIQVADVPGRFEPGTGEVNWPGVAKALKAMGYKGMVTLESWASGRDEDALEAFQKAFSV
jgi:hydroxypyruvate isomerase